MGKNVTSISQDDRLIWDTPVGTVLTCIRSVVMVDGEREVAFTEGRKYTVKAMNPIADPAYIELINDQGGPHKMEGEHVRKYFKR